jgi:hypothetical protein
MKKQFSKLIIVSGALVLLFSCGKSFLDQKPYGSLDPAVLANQKGVESLLIGAYSLLDGYQNSNGIGGWESAADNWVYGSVVGGDAHKGSDASDQPDIIPIELHQPSATNNYFNVKWKAVYEGITRANIVLKVLAQATDVSDDDRKRISGEARFLRAHYHFEARKMWGKVPFIDETMTDYVVPNPNVNVPNTEDILPKIEADLQYAYDNLPEIQANVGRANKWAAAAMLGKCYMFEKKYTEAKAILEQVYLNGKNPLGTKYGLLSNFQDNFNAETKNLSESVFAVQSSVNDGSGAANANYGDVLNMSYGGPWDCCGFFVPSQDLVNSFKTDPTTGLPDVDTYNTNPVKSDQGLKSDQPFTPYTGTVDPRLDWTVGRRGVPYLDWGPHPGFAWMRDQQYSGPYSPVKDVYYKRQKGSLTDASFWSSTVTAINYNIIRFADVILWLAECEVEAPGGDLEKARAYVNEIRGRAANTASWVNNDQNKYSAKAVVASEAAMLAVDAKPGDYVVRTDTNTTFVLLTGDASDISNWQEYTIPNYKIGLYTDPWTDQAVARKAVHFERKLELAMEGHRFFDLVRWGEAATTLNNYLQYEKTLRSWMSSASFTTGKDEYFPIPQRQIDLSNGTLQQNPGY